MAVARPVENRQRGPLERFSDLGLGLTSWTERWIPDAWIVALILTAIATALAAIWGNPKVPKAFEGTFLSAPVLSGAAGLLDAWGRGLWALLTLMGQFSLSLLAAYAAAVSPPLSRFMDWLGRRPNPEKPWQAILLMAVFSLTTGWLNWAFTVVVSALFVPYVARHNPKVDFRLLVATAYLGVSVIWHAGISGSGPLIAATPNNFLIQAKVLDTVVSTDRTIFSAYNLVLALLVFVLTATIMTLLTPRPEKAYTISKEDAEGLIQYRPVPVPSEMTPATKLNWWPGWNLLVAGAMIVYMVLYFSAQPGGFFRGLLSGWTIDIYNLLFLAVGILLHWRPVSYLNAASEGIRSAWGVVLQFPFYAGIFGLVQNTELKDALSTFFTAIATPQTYVPIVYFYSGLVNYIVPSGGSKFALEAAYILQAGRNLGVSDATVVLAYAWGDMMTDIIQPFWAIPLLAVVNLRFGQIMGYTTVCWVIYMVVVGAAMFFMPLNL